MGEEGITHWLNGLGKSCEWAVALAGKWVAGLQCFEIWGRGKDFGELAKNTLSYYVTHPTSMVDYDDEYQQDDIQTNSEDPLTSAMLLLARAITKNFSNLTNNRLRTSSNTRNQAVIQGDRVNIQSRNFGLFGIHLQEILQLFNATTVMEKDTMQGIIQSQEFRTQNTSWNKCCWPNMMKLEIQPTNHSSDVRPSYDSAFISEVQSSSINENEEQMYPTHTKIINNTIGDDQIDSNIIFDTPNGNVNSGSVEKYTHVPDLYTLEQLSRNAYQEAKKQQIFAQKVQKQNKTLTSQLELYKERVRVLENINEDNNYLRIS
nr:hypothetical protein [Tanacetum cinerariifolium]